MPTELNELDANAAETGFANLRRKAFEAHVASRRLALKETVANAIGELGTPVRLTVELGCGHGHFLSNYAYEHTEEKCLGIDFSRNRIRRAARKQVHADLSNLRFLCAEIRESFEAMPSGLSFSRVFILYPDPWPKRRHGKYRLMSEDFLRELADRCMVGCQLFFRTDSDDYFSQTKDAIERSEGWSMQPDQQWVHEFPTVFQQRTGRSHSAIAIRR